MAAHSLSADIVISLPIIAREQEGTSQVFRWRGERGAMRGSVERRMRVAETISLSATGSKKAPNAEESFIFLARYPSSQSVTAAARKMRVQAAGHQGEGVNQRPTRTGMARTRPSVRSVGSVRMGWLEGELVPSSWLLSLLLLGEDEEEEEEEEEEEAWSLMLLSLSRC